MSDSWRLFVAAYPPPDLTARLLALLRQVTLPRHREVPPEQVHLTLQFIGDVDQRQYAEVRESVSRSCAGLPPIRMWPYRLATFHINNSPRRPARLVAAVLAGDPAMEELHRRLAHRLTLKPKDRERFVPHLTIARFSGGGAPISLALEVELPAVPVGQIHLVRSVLHPSGAEHRTLDSFTLDGR